MAKLIAVTIRKVTYDRVKNIVDQDLMQLSRETSKNSDWCFIDIKKDQYDKLWELYPDADTIDEAINNMLDLLQGL